MMKTTFICLLMAAATLFAIPAQAFDAATIVSTFDADTLGFIGGAGLIVNKATLDGLSTNIKTTFQKALDIAKTDWQETTMLVTSTGSENDYKWLTGWKGMKKWVGDKVINALKANNYIVANDDYEDTIEVDRNDIEDGNLGGYSVQAAASGESAGLLYDELDADAKNGAFANKCYDNQFFYDTDHPVEDEDGNTISVSNTGTVALSVATIAAARASYGVARTAMMKFTRDGGKPLGLIGDTLEVGPGLEEVGRTLLEHDELDDGNKNPFKGTAKLKVNPRITSDTQWMLHVTNRQMKPFLIQERKKPMFISSDENVFLSRKFLYSVEARCASAYGLWQLSWGSTGTG